jgi:hypothetical protein
MPLPVVVTLPPPEIRPLTTRLFVLSSVNVAWLSPSTIGALSVMPVLPALIVALTPPEPSLIAPFSVEPEFSVRVLVPPVKKIAAARVLPSLDMPPEIVPALVIVMFAPLMPAPPTPAAPLPAPLAPPFPPFPPAMAPALLTVPPPVTSTPAAPAPPLPPTSLAAPPRTAPPVPPLPPVTCP